MSNKTFFVIAIVVAIAGLGAGYQLQQANSQVSVASQAAEPDAAENENRSLEQWIFDDVEGRSQHLAQWPGKLLVVNFWATWCPPCLKEIPGFVTLQDRYAEAGVQFVGIALDDTDKVKTFARENAVNYPLLVGQENLLNMMEILGNTIGGLPYTAIFSRDGELLKTHQGEWSLTEAEATLIDLL